MRKTKTITIDRPGRDRGKMFVITEMPASQAERWCFRALEAIARAGIDVPEDLQHAGIPALVSLGLKSLLAAPFSHTESLLAEMFECVKFVPDPKNPTANLHAPLEEEIEEVATRAYLRSAVFELHTGFSAAAFLSKRWAEGVAAFERAQRSKDTSISDESAEQ